MEKSSPSSSSSSSVSLLEDEKYLDDDDDLFGETETHQEGPSSSSVSSTTRTAASETASGKKRKRVWRNNLGDDPLCADECYVDWDGVLVDPLYGATRLNRYISVVEVDALTGWATHRDRPSYNHDISTSSANNLAPNSSHNNPLFGVLPYAPPRPSVVRYMIQDTARQFCARMDDDQQEVSERLTRKFPEAAGVKDHRHPSALEGRLDHSAAVAIAMLAEEVLTASLMPLAVRHVRRCRDLEDRIPTRPTRNDSSSVDDNEEHDKARAIRQARQEAFDGWTLPPEEAIQKLLLENEENTAANTTTNIDHESNFIFARAQPPTRSAVPGAPGTSLLNQPRAGVREQHALVTWCQSQQLNPDEFVTQGSDTTYFGYEAFVPPTATAVGRNSSSNNKT